MLPFFVFSSNILIFPNVKYAKHNLYEWSWLASLLCDLTWTKAGDLPRLCQSFGKALPEEQGWTGSSGSVMSWLISSQFSHVQRNNFICYALIKSLARLMFPQIPAYCYACIWQSVNKSIRFQLSVSTVAVVVFWNWKCGVDLTERLKNSPRSLANDVRLTSIVLLCDS